MKIRNSNDRIEMPNCGRRMFGWIVAIGGLSLSIACSIAGSVLADEVEAFTEPYQHVAVPSPEIGVIDEILVHEGAEVSQGQVLFRLDDRVLRAGLEVASAAKDATGASRSAEVELKLREKQRDAYRDLIAQGNATERELDRAEGQYDQAAAQLQSVREDLEIRRLEYERVKAEIAQRQIQSPINGFVVRIEKEVGEFVSPNDAVTMHVVNLKELKAVFSVPYAAASSLQVGDEVSLSLGVLAPESTSPNASNNQTENTVNGQSRCDGVIEFISPIVDAESGSVSVKIRISNADRTIPAGIVCRWDTESKQPIARFARPSKQPGESTESLELDRR